MLGKGVAMVRVQKYLRVGQRSRPWPAPREQPWSDIRGQGTLCSTIGKKLLPGPSAGQPQLPQPLKPGPAERGLLWGLCFMGAGEGGEDGKGCLSSQLD